MAFGSPPLQFSSDAAKSSPPCRSRFQKCVHLRDWWLTKPEPDDDRKTIGVAGLTCTSQQSRAERCFSSAPILKVYDFFELETVDGVCVILQGYINKNQTLESGFPSEVFDHFLIGFPPYWEEYCTSWDKTVSAAKGVSRVNEDGKDSIEGHDNFHDSSQGKLLNRDCYSVDMGVEDCEDTILSNKAGNFVNKSSLEIPHEHIVKVGHAVLCERSSLTSEFEDPSSKNFKIDAEDSHTVSKCLGVSSRRVTRSMTKLDSSKNHSAQRSLLDDIINLDQATIIDPNYLGSFDIPRKDTNDSLSNKKAVNVVDCDGTDFLHVGNLELRNSRSCHKGNSSSDCGVKCESRKDISTSEENLDEQNVKNISSVVYENVSKEASTCSNEMVSRITAAEKGIVLEEARMTRSKSKRKLKSGSSSSELTKRALIKTPKSAKSTSTRYPTRTSVKKGSKDRHGSANILSPESFSGKKSRSGRVLLPALEFWRNQTAIYDADRQVTGVLEGASHTIIKYF